MVYINLSKLVLLIQAIQGCPVGIPSRLEKLFDAYNSFEPSSEDLVSISVSVHLERLREEKLDREDEERKREILKDIITTYNSSSFKLPSDPKKIYLISPLQNCNNCQSKSLVVVRPHREGRKAVVYTRSGGYVAEVFHKHCSQCQATLYNCYTEYTSEDNKLTRKYLDSGVKYYSITQDTFFDVELLEVLSEDIFTCDCRITSFVVKYNRLNAGSIPLNIKRIFHAWLIFSINKRIQSMKFPVLRSNDRNLDVEKVCQYLYPELKRTVDAKWVQHSCKKCASRVIVMDGAAKVYRTVCAAKVRQNSQIKSSRIPFWSQLDIGRGESEDFVLVPTSGVSRGSATFPTFTAY